MTASPIKLGLVGARGYVGLELMRLIGDHPGLQLGYASSRELVGQRLVKHVKNADPDLRFETLDAEAVAKRDVDICVLALPNGLSDNYAAKLKKTNTIIVDLSGDHRFDNQWHYGLPELSRNEREGRLCISNPGCYATAMQLAIAPLRNFVSEPPHCFGVSGYSGAGTKPSKKNDATLLAGNLLPYQPIGHLHEQEVSHRLGTEVRFFPHVAEFFRGISMTVTMTLDKSMTHGDVRMCYERVYASEPLVHVTDEVPLVADSVGRHHATVGGWQLSANGRRLVVFSTLDNLLKGAATQAIQNINLACEHAELEGLDDELSVGQ
ncbi:MAG: N-acetyl-gamma-glutamyl-phosphate reductase [Gammaproteobacteria bacterium]|nr:N-acetyl-gamma-glutamyl-phosphate reductase [Gammaproteobacteria bacterium]MDH3768690.1 N-acetyl-gamma-glutamyl-phosphate reductase [Gammaproteobacteria bacterium]